MSLLMDGFITRMQGPRATPEPDTLEQIMALFIEESLDTFFLDSAEAAGLNLSMHQLVRLTTQTISKASHLIVQRGIRKMTLAQYRAVGSYLHTIRRQDADRKRTFVVIPIAKNRAELVRRAPQLCHSDRLELARKDLCQYLIGLTDDGIFWFFEQPLALLQFGPVLKKMVMVTMQTCQRASHSLIHRIIPRLSAPQLENAAIYLDGLIHEFEDSPSQFRDS
ncbi:MAG: hypothetical protein R3292_11045 [Alcanivorax sp.]|nr:hypothetical protein [Alcanivorax sp.]